MRLSRIELAEFEACTCLSEAEIVGLYKKFEQLGGCHLPLDSGAAHSDTDSDDDGPAHRKNLRKADSSDDDVEEDGEEEGEGEGEEEEEEEEEQQQQQQQQEAIRRGEAG